MPLPHWVQCSSDFPRPSPRSGATSVLLNQHLYVFGGYSGVGRLNDVWKLDLQTYSWSQVECKGLIPGGRESNGAFSCGNRVMIFGGYSGTAWLNDSHYFELSDPNSGTWSPVTLSPGSGPPPSPRFGYAGAEMGGMVWIFGGYDGSTWLDDLHAFDFERGCWQLVESENSPTARSGQSFTALNGALWLFGGYDGSERVNDMFVFKGGEWSHVKPRSSIPRARYLHGSVGISSSIYIFAGFSGNDRLNDLWEYRTDLNSWNSIQTFAAPLGRSSLVAYAHQGALIIFGGFSGSSVLNDLWEIRLAPPPLPPSHFVLDLLKLINSPELTDARFLIQGAEVRANRALLAARSEHFKALFFGGLRESTLTDELVEIQGVDVETFKALLFFIASDQYPESARNPDSAMLLLIAAEMFLLDRLKAMCEDYLKSAINAETVAGLLLAAHKHGAGVLKEHCLEYLVEHESIIKALAPETLKDLVHEPTVLLEVLMRRPSKGPESGTR